MGFFDFAGGVDRAGADAGDGAAWGFRALAAEGAFFRLVLEGGGDRPPTSPATDFPTDALAFSLCVHASGGALVFVKGGGVIV